MDTVLNPQQHQQVLLDLFTRVTEEAAQLGLSPVGVDVRTYEVHVQIGCQDMAAVDRLADAFRLPPERDDPYENYDRTGPVDVAGHHVRLTVYTGRPKAAEVSE